MRRTVITAALLAAFAIPAFADDATTNKDQTPEMAKASVAGAVSKQDDAAQTVIKYDRSDCMHRRSSAMNMM